jgi:hypothetical protein
MAEGKGFDFNAAKAELENLRCRARQLERDVAAALTAQITELLTKSSGAGNLAALLQDIRKFVDERA